VSGQLHAPAAFPREKSPLYPLDRRLGGPQSWSGCCGKGKNLARRSIYSNYPFVENFASYDLDSSVFVCRNIRSVGCGFGTHLAIVCADHLLCLGPPLACLDEHCLCFHVLWILRHCPLTVFQLMWGISNMMSIIVCLVGSCTRVVMLMLLPAYVGYGSGSRQHCHL
jgi:hypothetical protein